MLTHNFHDCAGLLMSGTISAPSQRISFSQLGENLQIALSGRAYARVDIWRCAARNSKTICNLRRATDYQCVHSPTCCDVQQLIVNILIGQNNHRRRKFKPFHRCAFSGIVEGSQSSRRTKTSPSVTMSRTSDESVITAIDSFSKPLVPNLELQISQSNQRL